MSRRADPTPWANALTLLVACAMAGSWASARVSAGESREELARRHYGRGRELMRQGDYVSAGKSFRLAVMASPNDRSLKLGFGMALLAMGDYAYAAYCARRVSSADGDPSGDAAGGGGGGSVFIRSRTFQGGVFGRLSAVGGGGDNSGGGGGGGRIAVWYGGVRDADFEKIAQGTDLSRVLTTNSLPTFAGSTSVGGGSAEGGGQPGVAGTAVFLTVEGARGTVFLVR